MLDVSTVIAVVNGILLVVVFVLGIRMLNAASKYTYHVGDIAKQTSLKWTVLTSIVSIVAIGLLAAIFNILFA
jgi:hypothetical protein